MLATRELLLGLLQDRRKLARVLHVAVVLKLGTDPLCVRAPKIAADVPVQRVAQKPAVQVLHILLVQLAERRGRVRLPSRRDKHLAKGRQTVRPRHRRPFVSRDDHSAHRGTMNDLMGALFALLVLWMMLRMIGGGTWA